MSSSRRLPVPPGSLAAATGVDVVYAGGAAVTPRSDTTVVDAVGKDAGRCSSVGSVLPSERQTSRAYWPEPTSEETFGSELGTGFQVSVVEPSRERSS